MQVSHISLWSFFRVLITANLVKIPGLFLVFLKILTMLYSGWFRFILRFPILLTHSSEPLGSFQVHELQPTGITVTLMFHKSFISFEKSKCLPFHFFFNFLSVVHLNSKVYYTAASIFNKNVYRIVSCWFALVLCCFYLPFCLRLQSSTFWPSINFYCIYINMSNSLCVLFMEAFFVARHF